MGECVCKGWKRYVQDKHYLEFYGDRIDYCPWCGKKLQDAEEPLTPEETSRVRAMLRQHLT